MAIQGSYENILFLEPPCTLQLASGQGASITATQLIPTYKHILLYIGHIWSSLQWITLPQVYIKKDHVEAPSLK